MTAARSVAYSRVRAGYTGNLAGSHPGGTDDEAACQVLRPCAQYHDRRAIYRGNSYPPVGWVRPPFGGPTDRTSRDARIKRAEIVVRDRVSSLVTGRGGRRRRSCILNARAALRRRDRYACSELRAEMSWHASALPGSTSQDARLKLLLRGHSTFKYSRARTVSHRADSPCLMGQSPQCRCTIHL